MRFAATPLCLAILATTQTVNADVKITMQCIETSTSSGCGTSTCSIPAHFYFISGMPNNGDCFSDARTGTCATTLGGQAKGDNFDVGFLCNKHDKKRFHVELNTGGMIIEDLGHTHCHAALTSKQLSGLGICK